MSSAIELQNFVEDLGKAFGSSDEVISLIKAACEDATIQDMAQAREELDKATRRHAILTVLLSDGIWEDLPDDAGKLLDDLMEWQAELCERVVELKDSYMNLLYEFGRDDPEYAAGS